MSAEFAAWVAESGAPALFLVAFLAATLLPFSSEAALAAALAVGMAPLEALTAASLGNSLACVVNYGIGRFLHDRTRPRLEASPTGRRTLGWMERWGPASLLLSWAPVVGDPLTVVAGLARVSFGLFVLVVLPLRVLRYVLIAGLF